MADFPSALCVSDPILRRWPLFFNCEAYLAFGIMKIHAVDLIRYFTTFIAFDHIMLSAIVVTLAPSKDASTRSDKVGVSFPDFESGSSGSFMWAVFLSVAYE